MILQHFLAHPDLAWRCVALCQRACPTEREKDPSIPQIGWNKTGTQCPAMLYVDNRQRFRVWGLARRRGV